MSSWYDWRHLFDSPQCDQRAFFDDQQESSESGIADSVSSIGIDLHAQHHQLTANSGTRSAVHAEDRDARNLAAGIDTLSELVNRVDRNRLQRRFGGREHRYHHP